MWNKSRVRRNLTGISFDQDNGLVKWGIAIILQCPTSVQAAISQENILTVLLLFRLLHSKIFTHSSPFRSFREIWFIARVTTDEMNNHVSFS